MSHWDAIRTLPLHVDGYYLEPLEREVARGFTLKRTVVVLHGRGEEGRGEEVDYDPRAQEAFQADEGKLPFAGEHTLESFSLLQSGQTEYRRWAFESAALDLALRQAGQSLAEAVGRDPQPVKFVVSPGLGTPPSSEVIRRWLEIEPGHRFKLDPATDWTDDLIAELAATGAVVTADYKAYYSQEGDPPPDADLYRRVAEGFPEAYLEDPALTDETELVLEPHRGRVTWDAPIHSVADVEGLAFAPRVLNSKPSRFGRLQDVLAFYDHCEANGISLYGGGMFELGPGRGQIQYLASLFHPDAPNDVAPSAYNRAESAAGLPGSPLPPAPEKTGFRWLHA
jgi:L-alanine-DL-glutamate epimerase-like enolase superfamily enzyme